MKKIFLPLLLVVSLQGAPLPAQAANGMTDILSTMMQLFLWMMSGGSGMSGFSSYGMNPFSMNPYSTGGLGSQGYPNQWGAYPGRYGGRGSSPYSQYGYGGRSPYFGPYNNSYDSNYGYNRYGYVEPYSLPRMSQPNQEKTSSLIIQPIIISPGQEAGGASSPTVEYLPAHPVKPAENSVSTSKKPYENVRPPAVNKYDAWDYNNPLPGRWQGVNGEFLELGSSQFRLRSRYSEMQGTYQVKNGIMKATIFNRTDPVFMQYRMADGQLVFRSEDGQMMLFRRLD